MTILKLLILVFFILIGFMIVSPSYSDDRGNSYTNPPSNSVINESRYYAPVSFAGPPNQNLKSPISSLTNQQTINKSKLTKPNYAPSSYKYLKPKNYEPIDIKTPKPITGNETRYSQPANFNTINAVSRNTQDYSISKINIPKPYNSSFSTVKPEQSNKKVSLE